MNPSILSPSVLSKILLVSGSEITKKSSHKDVLMFKGNELVDYVFKSYNQKDRDKKEIECYINDTYSNHETSLRLIWPINSSYSFTDSKKKYCFLPDYLEYLSLDPRILNLDRATLKKKNLSCLQKLKSDFEVSAIRLPKKGNTQDKNDVESIAQENEQINNENVNNNDDDEDESKPYYFFEEDFKTSEYLTNIENLVENIQMTMLRIKGSAIDDKTFKVDYSKIENLDIFQKDFKNLVKLLPFADIKPLGEKKALNYAFFINLYNILSIHSLVEWKRTTGSLKMSNFQRVSYFNMFKYCVGGYVLSLNDIEHGILRGMDNFGVSKFKTIWAGLFTQNFSDRSKLRFSKLDGRRQMVMSYPDFGNRCNCIRSKDSFLSELWSFFMSTNWDIFI